MFIAGGAYAVFKGQHLITQIMNEEEAHRERAGMQVILNSARQVAQIGQQAGMAAATGGASAAASVGQMADSAGQKFSEVSRNAGTSNKG